MWTKSPYRALEPTIFFRALDSDASGHCGRRAGGWNNYDNNVSDHRPVGIKLESNNINFNPELVNHKKKVAKVVNILGADFNSNYSGLIIQFFDDGSVEKKYILE